MDPRNGTYNTVLAPSVKSSSSTGYSCNANLVTNLHQQKNDDFNKVASISSATKIKSGTNLNGGELKLSREHSDYFEQVTQKSLKSISPSIRPASKMNGTTSIQGGIEMKQKKSSSIRASDETNNHNLNPPVSDVITFSKVDSVSFDSIETKQEISLSEHECKISRLREQYDQVRSRWFNNAEHSVNNSHEGHHYVEINKRDNRMEYFPQTSTHNQINKQQRKHQDTKDLTYDEKPTQNKERTDIDHSLMNFLNKMESSIQLELSKDKRKARLTPHRSQAEIMRELLEKIEKRNEAINRRLSEKQEKVSFIKKSQLELQQEMSLSKKLLEDKELDIAERITDKLYAEEQFTSINRKSEERIKKLEKVLNVAKEEHQHLVEEWRSRQTHVDHEIQALINEFEQSKKATKGLELESQRVMQTLKKEKNVLLHEIDKDVASLKKLQRMLHKHEAEIDGNDLTSLQKMHHAIKNRHETMGRDESRDNMEENGDDDDLVQLLRMYKQFVTKNESEKVHERSPNGNNNNARVKRSNRPTDRYKPEKDNIRQQQEKVIGLLDKYTRKFK